MDQFDDELREIKREIVESRGLVIKTNNLTNALAADLKTISKRQIAFERRAIWNSAGANFLFVIVVVVVVKLAWDARIDVVQAETKSAKEKVTKLENDIKEMQLRFDDRVRAESAAAAFYELVRAGRKQEIIEGFEALRKEPLSRAEVAFFTDAVDSARADLSVKSYQNGLDHLRTGRWHEAAVAFEDAIRLKDSGSHVPAARLQLARAYRKLARQRDAIPILMQLSEASPDREIVDDAMFLLGECLIDIQAWNDAKTTLRAFIRRFPDSSYINDARMALADISLKHWLSLRTRRRCSKTAEELHRTKHARSPFGFVVRGPRLPPVKEVGAERVPDVHECVAHLRVFTGVVPDLVVVFDPVAVAVDAQSFVGLLRQTRVSSTRVDVQNSRTMTVVLVPLDHRFVLRHRPDPSPTKRPGQTCRVRILSGKTIHDVQADESSERRTHRAHFRRFTITIGNELTNGRIDEVGIRIAFAAPQFVHTVVVQINHVFHVGVFEHSAFAGVVDSHEHHPRRNTGLKSPTSVRCFGIE